ncbi:hypothetical protein K7432_011453 [Basidiobolus ranarum]|uniref:Uncharacterized protein n=1 Tax=Basidiobolus ranarum TaxID=34480 RepID=A0ABR2WM74_9FUNG
MRRPSAEYLLSTDMDSSISDNSSPSHQSNNPDQELGTNERGSKKDTISALKDKVSGSITSSVGSILGNSSLKKQGEEKIIQGDGKLRQCGMDPTLPDSNFDGSEHVGAEDHFHVYYTSSGRPNPGDLA